VIKGDRNVLRVKKREDKDSERQKDTKEESKRQ
jgi:hypothetical protein